MLERAHSALEISSLGIESRAWLGQKASRA